MDLTDRGWPAVAALGRDTPAVLPIAAPEPQGHHLPVFTDSLPLAGDPAESSLAHGSRRIVSLDGLGGNTVPSRHRSGGPWDL